MRLAFRAAIAFLSLAHASALAEPVAVDRPYPSSEQRAPCASYEPLRKPWFGDLHVHTAFSLDASTQDTRNRPRDAYRYARGEALGLQPYTEDGQPMRKSQLERPLDFAAVTDHAELLGEWKTCNTEGLPGYDSWVCRLYRNWPRGAFFWMNSTASRALRANFCGENGVHCLEASKGPWAEIQSAAEEAYDRSERCGFTSFVAYEWTGAAGLGNNFHRNVIFRNAEVPELPSSFVDSPELLQLWDALSSGCSDAGGRCEVIVIPHNSNLGGGMMFETVHEDGTPISLAEAEGRRRYESLVELMQHKGESECMLTGSSPDELCGFEKLTDNSFGGRYVTWLTGAPEPRQFVREAMKEGLGVEARTGVNPFRYGFVASTDTHLATPGLVAESASYPGHGGAGTPTDGELPKGLPDSPEFNPGGLAVLWAEENTRDSLFEAMRRREAYGTSGPRIVTRFFGGSEIPEDWCELRERVAAGYAKGVPMGGVLPAQSKANAPRFAVSAVRDVGTTRSPGTQLQRIQVVKGWRAADGELHERVVEVAGDKDNGASVDLATCATEGEGFDQLCGVWSDPDFDPKEHAFYYSRVVENPTCRWSHRVCLAAGVRCEDPSTIGEGFEACCDGETPQVIQERAWTSPIWYSPPSSGDES